MKFTSTFCALVLLAVLAGCGGKKPDTSPPKTEPAETSEGSSAEKAASKIEAAASTQDATPAKTKPAVKLGPVEPPRRVDAELRAIVARLVEKSPEGGWRINEATALELEKLGDEGSAELVTLLDDPQAEARRGAAYSLLPTFNPEDQKHVAGYIGLLSDPEPFLRSLGLQAVRRMQASDRMAALPRLTEMLHSNHESSPDNRAALARLLGSLKQDAAPALDALAAGAKDDRNSKVRGAYLVAISQIASPTDALPAFRRGLADPDPSVRLVAAARLRQLGKDTPAAAAPAAEDLAQALEDDDSRVREAAAEALALLGAAAVKPLSKHIDSKNAHTRQLAIASLGKIGSAAKSALPLIEQRLEDQDPEVKRMAEAVVKILQSP